MKQMDPSGNVRGMVWFLSIENPMATQPPVPAARKLSMSPASWATGPMADCHLPLGKELNALADNLQGNCKAR